ncbi:MAG: hypothetical protein KAV87_24345 [Desulfobacteraceae bacterium]|nr:hypothetical protein [Desulfobacteraceae bacterium]
MNISEKNKNERETRIPRFAAKLLQVLAFLAELMTVKLLAVIKFPAARISLIPPLLAALYLLALGLFGSCMVESALARLKL